LLLKAKELAEHALVEIVGNGRVEVVNTEHHLIRPHLWVL
jgi:hypothetical protein